jgi:hypothetical protein
MDIFHNLNLRAITGDRRTGTVLWYQRTKCTKQAIDKQQTVIYNYATQQIYIGELYIYQLTLVY